MAASFYSICAGCGHQYTAIIPSASSAIQSRCQQCIQHLYSQTVYKDELGAALGSAAASVENAAHEENPSFTVPGLSVNDLPVVLKAKFNEIQALSYPAQISLSDFLRYSPHDANALFSWATSRFLGCMECQHQSELHSVQRRDKVSCPVIDCGLSPYTINNDLESHMAEDHAGQEVIEIFPDIKLALPFAKNGKVRCVCLKLFRTEELVGHFKVSPHCRPCDLERPCCNQCKKDGSGCWYLEEGEDLVFTEHGKLPQPQPEPEPSNIEAPAGSSGEDDTQEPQEKTPAQKKRAKRAIAKAKKKAKNNDAENQGVGSEPGQGPAPVHPPSAAAAPIKKRWTRNALSKTWNDWGLTGTPVRIRDETLAKVVERKYTRITLNWDALPRDDRKLSEKIPATLRSMPVVKKVDWERLNQETLQSFLDALSTKNLQELDVAMTALVKKGKKKDEVDEVSQFSEVVAKICRLSGLLWSNVLSAQLRVSRNDRRKVLGVLKHLGPLVPERCNIFAFHNQPIMNAVNQPVQGVQAGQPPPPLVQVVLVWCRESSTIFPNIRRSARKAESLIIGDRFMFPFPPNTFAIIPPWTQPDALTTERLNRKGTDPIGHDHSQPYIEQGDTDLNVALEDLRNRHFPHAQIRVHNIWRGVDGATATAEFWDTWVEKYTSAPYNYEMPVYIYQGQASANIQQDPFFQQDMQWSPLMNGWFSQAPITTANWQNANDPACRLFALSTFLGQAKQNHLGAVGGPGPAPVGGWYDNRGRNAI